MAETLAERQEELKAGKVGEKLTDLKAASPVVTLAPTLAEMKAQTVGKTLSDVVPQALVETEAVAVAEKPFVFFISRSSSRSLYFLAEFCWPVALFLFLHIPNLWT